MEGDPPLIDCPALAFSPTNVIARQSLRSGGRFPLLVLSPVTRRHPRRETSRAWPPSVARLRSCRVGCRCLCPVSQVSSSTPHRLPRRFAMWTRNHPPTFPALPRAPGWFSAFAVPFLGHRLTCAVRYVAHYEGVVSAGQEVFSVLTGLSNAKMCYAQNISVHPLFMHRLCTTRR